MRPALRPAHRMEGLGLSPIRAIMAGAPAGAIPLGLGEPSWDFPEAGRLALAWAGRDCSYGPNSGLEALRKALADFYSARPEEVMLASGSQGALYSLFQAWLGPGDEVLVPDPGFLSYPILARLAGAQPAAYALGPGGRLDPAPFGLALDACPKARMAVINHPANPTGAGADPASLLAVARLCEERGIILVSDEVYRELYLGPRPASLRDVSAYGIVLSSASKAWGGPGLRVGWALGEPEILAPARLVHNYAVTAASRPAQEAALALVEDSPRVLPAARAELARRWEGLSRAMEEGFPGGCPSLPAGAFYLLLPLPEGENDSLAFCLRARDEAGVILAPGSAFGPAGEAAVRLSYAARPEALKEGIARLGPLWRK